MSTHTWPIAVRQIVKDWALVGFRPRRPLDLDDIPCVHGCLYRGRFCVQVADDIWVGIRGRTNEHVSGEGSVLENRTRNSCAEGPHWRSSGIDQPTTSGAGVTH